MPHSIRFGVGVSSSGLHLMASARSGRITTHQFEHRVYRDE